MALARWAEGRGIQLTALIQEDVAIELSTREPATIEFVGQGGEVLRSSLGTHARMSLADTSSAYLRARARAPSGAQGLDPTDLALAVQSASDSSCDA